MDKKSNAYYVTKENNGVTYRVIACASKKRALENVKFYTQMYLDSGKVAKFGIEVIG
jgi:hypothetical protein